MKLIATLLTFTLYLPLMLSGHQATNQVVAPIAGQYKFLQTDDWFQVICASEKIEVKVVNGYALVKCKK